MWSGNFELPMATGGRSRCRQRFVRTAVRSKLQRQARSIGIRRTCSRSCGINGTAYSVIRSAMPNGLWSVNCATSATAGRTIPRSPVMMRTGRWTVWGACSPQFPHPRPKRSKNRRWLCCVCGSTNNAAMKCGKPGLWKEVRRAALNPGAKLSLRIKMWPAGNISRRNSRPISGRSIWVRQPRNISIRRNSFAARLLPKDWGSC